MESKSQVEGVISADRSEPAIQNDRENRSVVRVIKLGAPDGSDHVIIKGRWCDLCEHNQVVHLTIYEYMSTRYEIRIRNTLCSDRRRFCCLNPMPTVTIRCLILLILALLRPPPRPPARVFFRVLILLFFLASSPSFSSRPLLG